MHPPRVPLLSPQVRFAVLSSGKTLLTPQPRLRTGFFSTLHRDGIPPEPEALLQACTSGAVQMSGHEQASAGPQAAPPLQPAHSPLQLCAFSASVCMFHPPKQCSLLRTSRPLLTQPELSSTGSLCRWMTSSEWI